MHILFSFFEYNISTRLIYTPITRMKERIREKENDRRNHRRK